MKKSGGNRSRKGSGRAPFLPASLRELMQRVGLQLLGVMWIVLGLVIAASLLSYDVGDPSFNGSVEEGRAATNWLGIFGSYLSDILIQGFGYLLPWFFALMPVAAGLRLVLCHPIGRGALRVVVLFFGVSLGALALPSSAGGGWLLSFVDGGWVGGLMARVEGSLASFISGFASAGPAGSASPWLMWIPSWGLRSVFALVAVLSLAWSLTLSPLGSLRFVILTLWRTAKFAVKFVVKFVVLGLLWRGLRMLIGKPAPRHEPSATGGFERFAEWRGDMRSHWHRALSYAATPFVWPLRGVQHFVRFVRGVGRDGGRSRIEPQLGGMGGEVGEGSQAAPQVTSATSATSTTSRPGVIHVGAETPERSDKVLPRRPAGSDYSLPGLDLLSVSQHEANGHPERETIERNTESLERVLHEFGIQGEIVRTRSGPIVTRYELAPAPGIKTGRVVSLADDIARSMSAIAARIAVVPGESTIGIELPNQKRGVVGLRELLDTEAYVSGAEGLPIALGVEISGKPVILDLARMPHLLVAGTTGSGKSVSLQAMLLSLLYRLPPSACKLIMVDPKMLELNVYDGIPHLITPVVTEPKKAIVVLKWAVREMESRNRAMSRLGARNLTSYNERLGEMRKSGEVHHVQTGYDPETGQAVYEERAEDLAPLPYIVIVVDEMADLMMVAGKEVESAVQRLSQMARAAGIHLIMATQRPSVDVITGTVKANFPSRISFQVTSKVDSRTILGEGGAEQLLGQGDMLYMSHGGRISRVHGPFVSEREVERVTKFLRRQGVPEYDEGITREPDEEEDGLVDMEGEDVGDLYLQAKRVVMENGRATTSYLQRRLGIGYNRAANLIERMEGEGFVSPPNASGRREIIGGS
ncbi:MAG: DNA translocase FtsK [Alphaproteobacteria bacterium]